MKKDKTIVENIISSPIMISSLTAMAIMLNISSRKEPYQMLETV